MTKLTDTEFTFTKMVQDMRVNGKMIFNMDSEKKSGQTTVSTRVITQKVKNMVKVFIYGKMVQCITEIGLKIESKDMVNINGKMEECMLDNGKIIICMVKVYTPGQMADDMKASTKWIKNTDMVCTNGRMEEYIKEIG